MIILSLEPRGNRSGSELQACFFFSEIFVAKNNSRNPRNVSQTIIDMKNLTSIEKKITYNTVLVTDNLKC